MRVTSAVRPTEKSIPRRSSRALPVDETGYRRRMHDHVRRPLGSRRIAIAALAFASIAPIEGEARAEKMVFGWTVPSKAHVTEKVVKGSERATMTYDVVVERAPDGK